MIIEGCGVQVGKRKGLVKSKIRPRYSNWETSWIGYERGSEVGKGEYT